ncbi:MAG TPA: MFS transporter [Gemmataceae bacterium]|jgi:MFS family permease|nr:MFS transporter [Gemmataceae bacterium]
MITLAAALLGWMFDGLEMGLFPLVAGPALGDLLGTSDMKAIPVAGAAFSDHLEKEMLGRWIAIITAGFLVGAATGGVLFGWLGDRIGRVRAMMLSILTYAIFSGVCGLAQNAFQVAGFRLLASIGMGGEWSLGVALVMEVWPDRSRAWLAGIIGSAANLGYLMIACVGLVLTAIITDLHSALISIGVGTETADWLVHNHGWRLLMLFGAFPALLTLLIQIFVPESHRWQAEKHKGTTSHWQTVDLLGVLVGASGAVGLITLWAIEGVDLPVRIAASLAALVVITGGYLYPIVRYIKRAEASDEQVDDPALTGNGNGSRRASALRPIIARLMLAAALSGVALLGTWASVQQAPTYANQMTNGQARVREYTQIATASGAVIGCIIAALLGDWLGRRITYALLCVGSMGAIAGLYLLNDTYGPAYLIWAFVAGTITAAFYGWLPLYLPELFRTKVRATGQGFGFNFGRILAAVGVLQLPVVMKQLEVGWQGACTAMSVVYVVGLGLICLAPETKGKPLPD